MFWEQHVGYKITFPWRYNTESKLNKKHPDIQKLNNILIYNIKWRTSRGTLSWLWTNNYSFLTLISKVARFPRNLQVFVVHVVYSKHKRLSKWCLDMFHCCSTLDLVLDLLYGVYTHLQLTNQRRDFQIWDTFAIDQSTTSLPNLEMLKPRTSCELLSNWSIYIYYICIIGQSKMNEAHDPTWNACRC